eukprot:TRINITY_DN42785_c0_g1_i1.p1 TRINITY_DN42785_c0_g1~~TRINITY_DN42785_c0_g1_i1.p1  ORF type:complete len:847 (-),score=129.65 TRINITY_DN42785_c0_g1_i1:326-2866(-)
MHLKMGVLDWTSSVLLVVAVSCSHDCVTDSPRPRSLLQVHRDGAQRGECKRWCLNQGEKTWEEKCAWKGGANCAGCLECEEANYSPEVRCADSCESDPLNWDKKCGWHECQECQKCGGGENSGEQTFTTTTAVGSSSSSSPFQQSPSDLPPRSWSAPGLCKSWCLQQEKPWEDKCANKQNCRGCWECSEAASPVLQCAQSCFSDARKWSVLCDVVYECALCPQCRLDYNPFAHVPPPSLPIPDITIVPADAADVNETIVMTGSTSAEVQAISGYPLAVALDLQSLLLGQVRARFSFAGGVPAGLSINIRSGTINWQPDEHQLGEHSVTAVAEVSDATYRLSIKISVVLGGVNPSGIYVWPSGGSDGNSGSLQAPLATVEHAAELAMPGDTIYIRGGSYDLSRAEELNIKASPEQPVLITRLPGERVRLVAQRKRHVFTVLEDSTGVLIRGLELDGNASVNDHWTVLRRSWWRVNDEVEGGWNGFSLKGRHITVEHCVIHDFNQKGVEISTGRYVTVRYNLIYSIGWTSLSGGAGVHRKWAVNFPDDDDPDFFRWDIYGNAIWAVEQRLYSYIPSKSWCLLELDEGKPISADSTKDKAMKARIAHNLVLFGGVDHIRLMVNPNLQVYNNAIMGEEGRTDPTPDGITAKGSKGNPTGGCKTQACVYGGPISNLTLFNNLVHTFPGSQAYGMTEQFSESDNPSRINHNYYSGGGIIKPEYQPGLIGWQQSPSVFQSPESLDFRPSSGIPPGVGVDAAILDHLVSLAGEYGVDIVPTGWKHDHCRNLQTILDSTPAEHLGKPRLQKSEKKRGHLAFALKVESKFYKDMCKCTTIELVLPHHMEHCLKNQL